MISGDLLGIIGKGAEWIEPSVDLDPAGVGLLDAIGEGIVAGRATHGAGEAGAPWLDGGGVNCIALRADLEDDGVHPERGELVEDGAHFGLLAGGAETGRAGPVDVINTGYPSAAKFAGEGGWALVDRGIGLRVGESGEQAEEQKRANH